MLVSAFSPLKHTDAVIKIDAVTKDFAYVTDGIDTFVESAGLHRAKQRGNNFAWTDTTSNGNLGTLFKLTLKLAALRKRGSLTMLKKTVFPAAVAALSFFRRTA